MSEQGSKAAATAPDGALGRAVTRGVVWSTLSFALTKGLAALSLLVLTRLLAPSAFGVVAAMLVVISVIELMADLGMSASVIYEQESEISNRVQVAFTVNMLFVSALTVVAFACAPLIASFFHAGHVALFRLISIDVFITGLGQVHDGLLLRDLRFNRRIVALVLNSFVQAAVGVTLAAVGLGAASLVWGMVCGTTAWTVSLWILTSFRPTLAFDRRVAASMLPYGIGASLLSFVSMVTAQIDLVMVGRVLGRRPLGLYSVAARLPALVLLNVANQVSLVAFPALSRKRVIDSEGVAAATHRLVRYQSLYALPLAVGMAVMAAPAVDAVFSRRWHEAAGVFAAISVNYGIDAATFALGDAFKALGRQRLMVVINLIQLPLLVVTVLIVAPYGITAVAWARAAGTGAWVVMMVWTAAWVLDVPVRGTLVAVRPGAAAALGALAGTGAVRIWVSWPAIPELLAAAAAGAGGALAALAVLSPASLRELLVGAAAVRRRVRRAVAVRTT